MKGSATHEFSGSHSSSRSVNLAMPELEAKDFCRAHGVAFFATRCLDVGGTQILCKTEEGAVELRARLYSHALAGQA